MARFLPFQVLALEFALRTSLGLADWLVHIDPDEALVFADDGSLPPPPGPLGSAGSASRFFAGLPAALDEV